MYFGVIIIAIFVLWLWCPKSNLNMSNQQYKRGSENVILVNQTNFSGLEWHANPKILKMTKIRRVDPLKQGKKLLLPANQLHGVLFWVQRNRFVEKKCFCCYCIVNYFWSLYSCVGVENVAAPWVGPLLSTKIRYQGVCCTHFPPIRSLVGHRCTLRNFFHFVRPWKSVTVTVNCCKQTERT